MSSAGAATAARKVALFIGRSSRCSGLAHLEVGPGVPLDAGERARDEGLGGALRAGRRELGALAGEPRRRLVARLLDCPRPRSNVNTGAGSSVCGNRVWSHVIDRFASLTMTDTSRPPAASTYGALRLARSAVRVNSPAVPVVVVSSGIMRKPPADSTALPSGTANTVTSAPLRAWPASRTRPVATTSEGAGGSPRGCRRISRQGFGCHRAVRGYPRRGRT